MSQPPRPLSVISASALVTASMIGVGVYTTSGYTLAALGSPTRVMAVWLAGGLVAICGAIGYGSLANRFTESGGEYLFLSRTLHPLAGLLAGWVSLLAGFTGAIAIAALGLASYLQPLLPPSLRFGDSEIAIFMVMVAGVLHTVGVRAAAKAQDTVVAIKLLLIGGFIAFALLQFGNWEVTSESSPSLEAPTVTLLDYARQLVWISFSYLGFNAAVYVAAEVHQPERNVPRAMIAGTVLVTVIYLLLNAIFVWAPSPQAITAEANIEQVAATAAQSIGGDSFATLVRVVIVISLFTSVSALVMTGPRVYAKMADDGFFPRWFRFRDRPPVLAIWFQAAIAIVAISLSTLKELLGYLGLTLSVCSALTVSMVFVLRLRGQAVPMPLAGIPAALYVSATLVLAVLYGISQPAQAIAAAVTIGAGVVLFPWTKKNRLLER